MAQRLDLPRILRIEHPDGDGGGVWTPMDICNAWADKRGFTTARGCRPDSYRAANELLRLSVEGKLVFCLRPPGFEDDEEEEEEEDNENDLAVVVNMVRNIQTAKKRKVEREPEVNRREMEGNSLEEEEVSEEEDSQTVSRNAFALLGDGED